MTSGEALRGVGERYQRRFIQQERIGLRNDLLVCLVAGLGALGSLQLALSPDGVRGAPGQGEAVAEVVRVLGGTRFRSPGTLDWQSLGTGAPLHHQDTIFVPEGAELVLGFTDGSTAHVDAGSLLVVERQDREGERTSSAVELRRGGILGQTAATSTLEVRSGKTSTTLKGASSVALRLDPEKRARVSVQGSGAQVRTGNDALELGARDELLVDGEGQVEQRLHHTIDLLAPDDGMRRLRLGEDDQQTFRWSGGAAGERTEVIVARDADLQRIVRRRTTTGETLTLELPASGIYFWGVRQAGATSPVRRLVVVRDHPPKPIEPRAAATVMVREGEALRFRWLPSAATELYRVRLLGGEAEAELIFEEEVSKPRFAYRGDLPEGMYRWEVRAVDPDHPRAIPRRRPRFRIINRALPDAPELLETDFEPLAPYEEGAAIEAGAGLDPGADPGGG
ncbi:MAG: hypothetical protein P1V51_07315 [Deltaproteobacteria bacterium]|nr:hypothetical protein [Deltaproteobacteria bacterium]